MSECRPCNDVRCAVTADVDTYSLEGIPPKPLPPTPPIVPPFGNDAVTYCLSCAESESIHFSGTLPSWISIGEENNCLVGAANTYRAFTKAAANLAAQNALNTFGDAAVANDTLICEGASDCSEVADWLEDSEGFRLRIKNYTPGSFFGLGACSCDAATSPEWDGTLPTFIVGQGYFHGDFVSVEGKELFDYGGIFSGLPNVSVRWREGQWVFELACAGSPPIVLWGDLNHGTDSPLGVYTKEDGCGTRMTLEVECYQPTTSCDNTNTDQYSLKDYTDGDIENPIGDVPSGGEVVWDGSYAYRCAENGCCWNATYFEGPLLLMDDLGMCNSQIFLTETVGWRLSIYAGAQVLWEGYKVTGDTPAGVYGRQDGFDGDPQILFVENIGGFATVQDTVNCLPT